eukprot:75383-Chlamydomonas_euryale.AAC.1
MVARGPSGAQPHGSGACSGGGSGVPPMRPHAVLVSVDLEWHEADQSKLLEIGWATWDSASRRVEAAHWIVKVSAFEHPVTCASRLQHLARCAQQEHEETRNGRYVPDHKHEFRFGVSEVGSAKAGAAALQAVLQPATWAARIAEQQPPQQPQQPLPRVALVGHGMVGDLKMLAAMGVALPPGLELLDTAMLAWALLGGKQSSVSLRNLLGWLQVDGVAKLHNAGNDA